MGNTREDQWTETGPWEPIAGTQDPFLYGQRVRVVRRPWVGGGQLQALGRYVLDLARRTGSAPPRSDLLATTSHDASDHYVVAYEGRPPGH